MKYAVKGITALAFMAAGFAIGVPIRQTASPSVTRKQITKLVGDVTVQNAHYEAWNLALLESIATRMGITPAQVDAVLQQVIAQKATSTSRPKPKVSNPSLQG